MPLPTASDVLDLLQGYCLDGSITTAWINDRMNNEVIPYVEKFTRSSFSGERSVTEWYSGTGKDLLILNRRNILAVTAIRLVSGNDIDTTINIASLVLLQAEGILKVRSGLSEYYNYRIFPKGNDNIQITYTYGGSCPADIGEAIKKLTAVLILDNIEGRTGGGQVSTQGYNRTFGNMGRYSNIRKRFSQQAHAILRRYSTAVVGA